MFTLPFVLVLAFALARLALARARARLAFAFVVRARPSTCLVIFASFRFSFDNLSPCVREFRNMNSFLRICVLDCPSPRNPSAQAVRFFVPNQRFRPVSQISSTLSCKQCRLTYDVEKPHFSRPLMTTSILIQCFFRVMLPGCYCIHEVTIKCCCQQIHQFRNRHDSRDWFIPSEEKSDTLAAPPALTP